MPPPTEQTRATSTRTFRLAPDLSEKLSDILTVEDITSATFLDPLVRQEIENRHRMNLPAITALRKARERAQKLRDEVPEMANDLGEAGA